MVVAVILAVSLVILTFLFHYMVLHWLSGGLAWIAMTGGCACWSSRWVRLWHILSRLFYLPSLGLGDVFQSAHLRFVTGMEALNGLLLIAWSGSVIYIAMVRLWPWQPCAVPARVGRAEFHRCRSVWPGRSAAIKARPPI